MKVSKHPMAVFCLVLMLALEVSWAAERKLSVNMVTGDVSFKRGKAKPKPVRKTTKLKEKDVIRTLVESSVEILLDDGSVLTIQENSVVDLSKLVRDGQVTNSKLDIKTGKVLFNIKKLASKRSDFVFETPTATAAIRGTAGGIGTDGKKTFAYLEEGGLELKPKGGGKPVLIKDLNVAVQTPKGFKVQQVTNSQALTQVVNNVTKAIGKGDTAEVNLEQVLDSAVTDTAKLAPADSSGLEKAPEMDSSKVDTSSAVETKKDTLAAADKVQQDSVETRAEGAVDTTASRQGSAQDTVATGQNQPLPENTEVDGPDAGGDLAGTDVSGQEGDSTAQGEANEDVGGDVPSLTLNVTSPSNGEQVESEALLTVSGTSLPGAKITARTAEAVADASGNFKLSLNAPKNPGSYTLTVSASLGDQSASQEISFVVPEKIVPLTFAITGPSSGQELPEGSEVAIAGTVTPGASVSVNGTPAEISSGKWVANFKNLAVGEHSFQVEAALGEQTQAGEVSISVVAKVIPLEFSLSRPADGATIKTSTVEISGTGTPGAKVVVNDLTTVVPASGSWNLSMPSPKAPGSYSLSAEATLGDQSLTKEINFNIPEEELKLTVVAPTSGAQITTTSIIVNGTSIPGAEISVQGKTAKADAAGAWSTSIQAPPEEGDYTLEVVAVFGSQEVSVDVPIIRVIPRQPILGKVNAVPATVQEAKLTITGTCNDGATIEIGSFSTIARGGVWSVTASWPAEEEGTRSFEVYCLLNGEEEVIGEVETEYVRPRIPLTFTMSTPTRVLQKAEKLDVKGTVGGQDIVVEVNGKGVPVIAGGFIHSVSFSEQNWDDLTEIEVVVSDGEDEIVKLIEVEVDKASPQINKNKPKFLTEPSIENNEYLQIRLSDDVGDEVTVIYMVDGSEEESFSFEGSFSQSIQLTPGIHDYRVEARDLAGNLLVWERRSVEYYPRVEWAIDVINPRANQVVPLPPHIPDEDFSPTDDVRIRIRSLPDDDFRYLKEVRIRNEANQVEQVWRDLEIDDIEFEFNDLPLVKNKVNVITIKVMPKIGPERVITRTYTMK